jgi:hypothetical protein
MIAGRQREAGRARTVAVARADWRGERPGGTIAWRVHTRLRARTA